MAITFGTIQEFNTGRQYSAAGQPIRYATFEDTAAEISGVVMWDMARSITKLLPLPGEEGVSTYMGERTPFTAPGGEVNKFFVMCLYDAYVSHKCYSYEIERLFQMAASKKEVR